MRKKIHSTTDYQYFTNNILSYSEKYILPETIFPFVLSTIFYKYYSDNYLENKSLGSPEIDEKYLYKNLLLNTSNSENLVYQYIRNLNSIAIEDPVFQIFNTIYFPNDLAFYEPIAYTLREINGIDLDLKFLFNHILRFFIYNSQKNNYFRTPSYINVLLSKLLLVRSSANWSSVNLYDPTCGFGDSLLTFDQHSSEQLTVYGEDINNNSVAIAKMNLYINNVTNSNIVNGNTLENPSFHTEGLLKRFDFIISHPPFRADFKHQNFHDSFNRWTTDIGNYRYADPAFLFHIIASLKSTGRAAVVVPNSLLTSNVNADYLVRKALIDRDLLKGVITLPSRVYPNTNISTSILLIGNYDFIEKDHVIFIDGSFDFIKEGKNTIIDNDSLEKHLDHFSHTKQKDNYSVLVTRETLVNNNYFLHSGKYLVEAQQFGPNSDYNNLKDLIQVIKLDRISEQIRNIKMITPQILNNNIRLKLNKIQAKEINRNASLLTTNALLVSYTNRTFSFSYFEHEEDVALSPFVTAYSIDFNKITLPYLAKQFTEDYFTHAIRQYLGGTSVVGKISSKEFLNFSIKLIKLEEQKRLEEEYLRQFHLADKNLDILEQTKDSFFEEYAGLRHSIAGRLRNIDTFYSKMIDYLKDNQDISMRDILNIKEGRYNFNEMNSIVKRDLNFISEYFKTHLDFETRILTSKIEAINLDNCLKNYVFELSQTKPYKVIYNSFIDDLIDDIPKEDYTTILGNETLIRLLLDNLVENAEKHAFLSEKEKKIEIELFDNLENGEIGFSVSNTGDPFPEKFSWNDYLSKGRKFGANAGTGYGGWYINQIIIKMNGEIKLLNNEHLGSDYHRGFVTTFCIVFSLSGGGND
ncbi:N-6 DNA methylase [Sphingobacterium siyangense]|uniref:N-6 DNA methylase n=1 Tax=Sphingobacterium siyangense TaxID=459529 RepID=UPI003DA3A34F